MRLSALRERAGTISFANIAEALLWYAEHHERKESPPSTLGSREPMAPTAAIAKETYNAILGCLVERSPEDYPFDPKVTTERVEKLARYYLSKKPTPAEDLDEIRKTRNTIRRRMKKRGLVR